MQAAPLPADDGGRMAVVGGGGGGGGGGRRRRWRRRRWRAEAEAEEAVAAAAGEAEAAEAEAEGEAAVGAGALGLEGSGVGFAVRETEPLVGQAQPDEARAGRGRGRSERCGCPARARSCSALGAAAERGRRLAGWSPAASDRRCRRRVRPQRHERWQCDCRGERRSDYCGYPDDRETSAHTFPSFCRFTLMVSAATPLNLNCEVMSFKLKLVVYFLLVSLLPLGAAGWALHSVARTARRVAWTCASRPGCARYSRRTRDSSPRPTGGPSASPRPSTSSRRSSGDRRELRRLLAANPGIRLESPTLELGPARTIAPGTRFAIVNERSVVGTLVAGVPLSRPRSRACSAAAPGSTRATGSSCSSTAALPAGRRQSRGAPLAASGRAETLPVAGTRYRTLATSSRGGERQPGSRAAHAAGRDRRRGQLGRPAAPDRAARSR